MNGKLTQQKLSAHWPNVSMSQTCMAEHLLPLPRGLLSNQLSGVSKRGVLLPTQVN